MDSPCSVSLVSEFIRHPRAAQLDPVEALRMECVTVK